MRGFMLAAVLAAGVAGQAQDAEAASITSRWGDGSGASYVEFEYIFPRVTYILREDEIGTDFGKYWDGDFRFTYHHDGVTFVGTGSGRGGTRGDWFDVGWGRTTFIENGDGVLSSGEMFSFYAFVESSMLSFEDYKARVGTRIGSWEYPWFSDLIYPELIIDGVSMPLGDSWLIEHTTAVVPVPAAAGLLISSFAAVGALRLRRRR